MSSALPLSLRLAARELRGGLSGFRIFVACLALGVASIAGVGSVSQGLQDGLSREGRVILGGDASFSLVQREASPEESAFFASGGGVSAVATLRAMARAESGAATLAELKAADAAYPLAGALETVPQQPTAELLATRDGIFGAVADPALLSRLGIKPGERIQLGNISLEVRAELRKEPDNLSDGIGFGPRLFVSDEALGQSGLVEPGSLVRWTYRVALRDPSASALAEFVENAKGKFPDAGWRVRTRDSASDRLDENVERFTQFLTLVGLTALLVGGVGVANAVGAYVARRRDTIAVLKCLGAPGARIFAIYFLQIFALAAVGIAIGLVVGAALPFLVEWAFGAIIPLPFTAGLQPGQLALAALYGFLVAALFAIWPLGRARDLPVSALFRDHLAEGAEHRPPRAYIAATAALLAVVAALMVWSAAEPKVALIFLAAAAAIFLLLRLVALAIAAVARRLPRPRSTELRLALANVHRPGALTSSVVLSLGLGLSLLVALTLIDASIRNQLTSSLPERAPSFFFIDIPNDQSDAFTGFLAKVAPGAAIEQVPMLRGRITGLKGQSADGYPAGEAAWVLRGDRGLTHASAPPEGSRVAEGSWWAPDHAGENLVSFEAENARELGLKVGDEITVNVLGREITARIANLREVEWESLGINFVMVFSPNTFAGAPYQHLATLSLPNGGTQAQELALLREAAAAFPSVIAIRVKDALATINDLVSNLALAIRSASGVTLLASVLVLAGALAAGHRFRVYDAMILKTLGASRPRIIAAYALEYLILGSATAIFGLLAGGTAAYVVVTQVMKLPFFLDIAGAAAAAGFALLLTIALGLLGTWRIVNRKPAAVLRDL